MTENSSEMVYAKRHQDLLTYQLARKLARDVFVVTKKFPKEETYSLIDQIRRSSRSVGAQIAEAWAKRRYEAHFISKLTDADAEQQETQHWIGIAHDCGYLSTNEARQMASDCQRIGRLIGGMIAKSGRFCQQHGYQVRELLEEYFVTSSTGADLLDDNC